MLNCAYLLIQIIKDQVAQEIYCSDNKAQADKDNIDIALEVRITLASSTNFYS